jgi:replicative DNA helicase
MATGTGPNGYGNRDRTRQKPEATGSDASGRMPPNAGEIEEAVLGGMLIEREAASVALEILKPDDFYQKKNQHIFEAIVRLYSRDNPVDILTVENELRDKNLLDEIGGAGYLSLLTRAVSSAANIEYHSQIIADKAIKRKLIHGLGDIIGKSFDNDSDPYELLDMSEQYLFELSNTNNRLTAKPVRDVISRTIKHLEEIQGKAHGVTGVATSLDIDKLTAGWQKGDLVIIAARPSMGKTAFVLTMARNIAMNVNEELRTPIALFSLEMSDQQLVQRLLTMEARIDAQAARTGRLTDEEFKRLIESAGRLYNARIFIDDTPGLNIMELRSKCRRLKSEHDIGVVIVDYLQLMTGNTSDRSNREQEIANISRGLKALAKELSVPVIALSQLSRAVEQRGGNKKPQLSDLRESGSIEQDADVVCFLYRPQYYGITTDDEGRSTAGLAEVIIGKQRNGPTGTISLRFVEEYARFENFTSLYNDLSIPGGGIPFGEFDGDGGSGSESGSAKKGGKKQLPPLPDDEESPF